MHPLTFKKITQTEFAVLQAWFHDEELRLRVNGPTTQEWFDYVSETSNVYVWMISELDRHVGVVQVDIVEDIGYLSFFVNPALRNQGYGKKILQTVDALPELTSCKKLTGGIEEDNIASRRCVEACGYRNLGPDPDEDGMLLYEHELRTQVISQ